MELGGWLGTADGDDLLEYMEPDVVVGKRSPVGFLWHTCFHREPLIDPAESGKLLVTNLQQGLSHPSPEKSSLSIRDELFVGGVRALLKKLVGHRNYFEKVSQINERCRKKRQIPN